MNDDRTASGNAALLHRLFWRLHFWSGLLTAPVVLFAALTGVLYIFTPQIEGWKHADLDKSDRLAPAMALDLQVQAAHMAFPDKTVRTIVPAYAQGSTTQVLLGEPGMRRSNRLAGPQTDAVQQHASHEQHQHQPESSAGKVTKPGHGDHDAVGRNLIVYVNPGTAQVQGSIPEAARFRNWSRRLHSTMLQGDGWRWVIELGASWMLLMMVTGIYLWWPRGKAGWAGVLVWRRSGGSRVNWRYWHGMFSVVTGIFTLTILLTGLTWSKYAGENFRALQNATAQNSPRVPRDLQSVMPANGHPPLSMQSIYARAMQQVPDIQIQLTPPKGEQGVWRIENYDRSQPDKRFQLVMDAYSGATLYKSGWEQMPGLSRATAVGIPFHRGEFGWWNKALLLLVGLSVIFSVVSGYVMWLKRRKATSLSAPGIEVRHVRAIPWWMWLTMAALGIALPVLGVSLLLLVLMETGFLFKQLRT